MVDDDDNDDDAGRRSMGILYLTAIKTHILILV